MRLPDNQPMPESVPRLGAVEYKSLYKKTTYQVETADHWTLVITRYQPVPQAFPQPLLDEPLLLVHGFSQNRHAWTSGSFVRHLLQFGVDIHVLELRGHGKSSIKLQRQRAALGKRLPADLDYGWDIDSYFLYDLPAAVAGVKRATRRDSVFYCGHSMGGMLGYGYAGLHDDLAGLITIGAASELGRGFAALRAACYAVPPAARLIDGALAAHHSFDQALVGSSKLLRSALALAGVGERLAHKAPAPRELAEERFTYVPVDEILRITERVLARNYRLFDKLWPHLGFNPARVAAADVRWLLREGGEREPRRVVEQFARWVRRSELVCYRTGYDFKRGFSNIEVPVAIIFGDMDRLASVDSTRAIYRGARSDYLLWRPVRGNSHVELTMGRDTEQICYDVKNLIDFARRRGAAPPRPEPGSAGKA